jgi:ABC-type uncharacterized transport system YnjBCD substrate-binding protein
MRQAYKYTSAILLIILFSLKMGAQACSLNPAVQKSPVEQQESKSAEDNSLEKSTNLKTDFIPANFQKHFSETTISNPRFFVMAMNTSLPVQYFAIPTPPPWNC